MRTLRQWFIGAYLDETEDVFVRAKIELLYSYTFFYFIAGSLFYINLIAHGLWYHVYLISFAVVALGSVPFILKYTRNLRLASNWFIIQQLIISVISVFIQEGKGDMGGGFWLMQSVLFSFFLYGKKWGTIITLIFIFGGSCPALFLKYYDVPDSQQIPDSPDFFLVPLSLCIYVVWMFIKTRENAEKKINSQKQQLETKNKEITDSIHYARRIQNSLMPNEKYIARVIKEMKGSE